MPERVLSSLPPKRLSGTSLLKLAGPSGPASLFWEMDKGVDDGSGPQIGKTHQTENYGSLRIVKVSYRAANSLN